MKHLKKQAWPQLRQRLHLMLVLCVMGFAVSIIMVPAAAAQSHIYALKNGSEAQFFNCDTTTAYDSDSFYIHPCSGKEPQVVLQKGQQVTLHAHDRTLNVTSRLETVSNLLHRLHLAVDAEDMIIFDLDSDTLDITLSPELVLYRDVVSPTTFPVERIPKPLMPKGEEVIKQAGVPGTVTDTYADTYRMGMPVGSELVKSVSDDAVTEIVEYGTLVSSVSDGDYITEVHPDAGYLTFASGDTMTYSYVTTCNATAYSGGWGTASGAPVGPGTVAVDTSVFPFGTRFFIESESGWVYGMGTAKDRGSSIKGNKIDLWFDEYGTACAWGRRDCTVYVLN